MKKKIKKMWIEALRSGKYKQGKNRLKNDKREFCCLGVLCDLHRKFSNKPLKWRKLEDPSTRFYDGQQYYLPKSVQEWAGLDDSNPGAQYTPLGYWNDSGKSFAVIVELIEKHL